MNGSSVQTNVPLWVAVLVGALIASLGFLLAAPADPTISWLTPSVRLLCGALNAALGAVAIALNIKRAT